MITYPLNNVEYSAGDAQIYHATRTSGVAYDSFDLTVGSDGKTLSVNPGLGWMRLDKFAGVAIADRRGAHIGTIGTAPSDRERIDAVAIRFRMNTGKTEFEQLYGTQGGEGPKPTRTSQIFDLILYHIRRKPGAATITADDVIDLRSDPAYCGYMMDDMTGVDPTLSRRGYVADAYEVGRRIGQMLTKAEFEKIPYVKSYEDIPGTRVGNAALYIRKWSDGHIDYIADPIYLGIKASVASVKDYAMIVNDSGFQGIVPIQLGQGAEAPVDYSMGQIITNGMGRTSVALWGSNLCVAVITDKSWSGWKIYAPSEASVLLPEPLPENDPVPGSDSGSDSETGTQVVFS